MTTKDITTETPQGLLAVLCEQYGLPNLQNITNVDVDKLYYARELIIRLAPIARFFSTVTNTYYSQVLMNQPDDKQTVTINGDEYQGEIIFADFRKVNKNKLLAELPDVYEELAYIEPQDVRKILGEVNVRNLLRKYDDVERLPQEQIRVEDLRKVIGDESIDKYCTKMQRTDFIMFTKNGKGYSKKYWVPDEPAESL